MRSFLWDKRVLAAVLFQGFGYAALLAVYPHSETTSVVTPLQAVPIPVLLPLALVAVPAIVMASAIGWIGALFGASPIAIPALLLARGDVIVFLSAYALGIALVWTVDRRLPSARTDR